MDASSFQDVVYTRTGRVLTLRLNRPEQLNGYSAQMTKEMTLALDDARRDDGIGAVVITGTGRAFSAGGDAKTIVDIYLDGPAAQVIDRSQALSRTRHVAPLLAEFDKPTIAAVNGVAAGAGYALALVCDIRIASDQARMGNIYMRRGTIPSLSPYHLPQIVRIGHAQRLILGDELVEAAELAKLGVVNRVVPAAALMDEAAALAERIAARPLALNRLTKRLLRMSPDQDFDTLRRIGSLMDASVAQE